MATGKRRATSRESRTSVKAALPLGRARIRVIRAGDTTKPDPFTICIVANPVLEAPWNSGTFVADPIVAQQPAFNAAADYVERSLFGLLPNQRELFISDPSVGPRIRLVSLFVSGLAAANTNSLGAEDSVSNLLIARRTAFAPFLARYGLHADIAYAVSASRTHVRASAWFTTDDDGRPGVSFTLDGNTFAHRYYALIPGTVALPVSSSSLTALHEFGHALSSYSNGAVTDLYMDSQSALNNKRGRPIPAIFANYNGTAYNSNCKS